MLVMVIVIAAADIEIKTYTLSMRFPCIVDVDDSSASSWQTLYEVPRQLFFEVLPHRYIDDFADGAQLYNLYCFTNDFDESRLYFQFTCIQRLYLIEFAATSSFSKRIRLMSNLIDIKHHQAVILHRNIPSHKKTIEKY